MNDPVPSRSCCAGDDLSSAQVSHGVAGWTFVVWLVSGTAIGCFSLIPMGFVPQTLLSTECRLWAVVLISLVVACGGWSWTRFLRVKA